MPTIFFLNLFFLFAFLSPAYAEEANHNGTGHRFEDNGNGTVTDNSTGLMWTKDANLMGRADDRDEARLFIMDMNKEAAYGFNDWRMPSMKELHGLADSKAAKSLPLKLSKGKNSILGDSKNLLSAIPALPAGHLFKNVVPYWYWSFTDSDCNLKAWVVNMATGQKWGNSDKKRDSFYVWPVRGKSRTPK